MLQIAWRRSLAQHKKNQHLRIKKEILPIAALLFLYIVGFTLSNYLYLKNFSMVTPLIDTINTRCIELLSATLFDVFFTFCKIFIIFIFNVFVSGVSAVGCIIIPSIIFTYGSFGGFLCGFVFSAETGREVAILFFALMTGWTLFGCILCFIAKSAEFSSLNFLLFLCNNPTYLKPELKKYLQINVIFLISGLICAVILSIMVKFGSLFITSTFY